MSSVAMRWCVLVISPGRTRENPAMGEEMASSKPRPAHVPEENVYEKMHWMVVVTYIVAIAAVALLLNGGS